MVDNDGGGVGDACSACKRTGVPLLANDDPSNPQAAHLPPGQKPRFCPDCMIGKKVRVFWPVDNSWYTGTVQQYDSSTGEHLLKYDDDDTEWVKIGESGSAGPSASAGGRAGSPPRGEQPPPVQPSSPEDKSGGDASPSAHHPHMQYPGEQEAASPPHPWHYPGQGGRGMGPQQGYLPYGAPNGSGGPPPPHSMYPHYMPPPQYSGYPGHSYQPPPYGYPPIMGGPPPTTGPNILSAGADKRHSDQGSPPGDKNSKRKAGPKVWTKEEDNLLLSMVQSMRMPMKWSIVAQQMPDRTGKQCRERYVNHLNPRLKVADWNPVEDATIFHLYNTGGSHWAKMSKMIPGRTDNGIKNRFHNLRRQLEREDEHRMRLSKSEDFRDEIRLDRLRDFPANLKGKSDELWDIGRGIGVLAAQSVLGGGIARNAGRFGPFETPSDGQPCVRCGLLVPSVHCGREVCTKTGWCLSCTRIPPHISGNLLRECLNLRRAEDASLRSKIEGWDEPGGESNE